MRRRLMGYGWTASAHPFAPDPPAADGGAGGAGAGQQQQGQQQGQDGAGGQQQGAGAGGTGTGSGSGQQGGQGTGTGDQPPAVPATIEDVSADTAWPAFAAAHNIPAVPWAQLPPADQVTYWRFHARKNEARVPGDLDGLRTKAKQWDDFEAASRTEQQQAVIDAREAGKREALVEAGTATAETLIRAQLEGHRTPEQIDTLLGTLDLPKFVGENGRVDAAKVSQTVQSLTGISGGTGRQQLRQRVPGMGQGHRTIPTGTPSTSAGRDRYLERKGSKSRNGEAQQ